MSVKESVLLTPYTEDTYLASAGTRHFRQPSIALVLMQYVLDGLDAVEVAVGRDEHASEGSHAAEQQLWKHEFFRDCLAPKVANFKVQLTCSCRCSYHV